MQFNRSTSFAWALAVGFMLGCGGDTAPRAAGTSTSAKTGSSSEAPSLVGAGATFPAPIYQKWFADYSKQNAGVRINYQGLGSSAGVNKVLEGTVDFGASDNAMKDADIAKVSKGVQLIPATAGSIVLGYNVP